MDTNKGNAWKKSYAWVLIANTIYILIFYFMMELFS